MQTTEFLSRRETLSKGLAERKIDAFLVAFSPNLRYLTGFTGSNGSLLAMSDHAILFTDPRYTIQAGEESCASRGGPLRLKIAKGPLSAEVAARIARLGVRKIGYEPARTTCDALDALQAKLPMKAALQPVKGWVEELRMVKSASELDRIRRSVRTNSRALEQTLPGIRAGMTERDLATELEYRMRRLGAEKPSFETIVASGARSALPHAQPTAAPLCAGSQLLIDMGAFQDGYASDMTRTMFLGSPSARFKRAYKAVLEAQLAAIDAVRPGVTAGSVDRAARSVLRRHGLDRAFVHSTGHGLGLEIHEPPRLGKREKTRLRAGMAITIEPGVYLEGWGGIRIEDTVVVTERGCEILTPTSKELRVV